MELGAAVKALQFVCFFTASLSLANHSLQYVTVVTARVNFTCGLVNGQQFLYYSSSRNKTEIAEWIKTFGPANYWDVETNRFWREQQDLHHHFSQVVKIYNHTAGDHTMQWIYGCELHNGTTRRYNLYWYDGTEFLRLDMNTLNWTTANEKAEIFKDKWTAEPEAKHMKNSLVKLCRELEKYVSHLNTSQRKVHPEVSVFQKPSPSPEVVCHATGFFPKAVMITWRKDGEEVHEDVELRETLPNQDGSFQRRSILNVSAEDLQKHTYTCVVQHSSMEKELVLEVPKGGGADGWLIAVIVAVVVALFALVLVAVGILIWKKKCCGDRRKGPHIKFSIANGSVEESLSFLSSAHSASDVSVPAQAHEQEII